MAGALERSQLHVEGRDDKFAMLNLLRLHAMDYDTKPWPAAWPEFIEGGSVEKLLRLMTSAVRSGTGRAVGFVLDANDSLPNRWDAIAHRLRAADVEVPLKPPAEGFVGFSPKYRSRVGVWLLPDNQQAGNLEGFLRMLIESDDPLIEHAAAATQTAQQLGASFSVADTPKATVHTWLAWQREPGLPYGTAMRAGFFQASSPAAVAFIAWFRRLFEINV